MRWRLWIAVAAVCAATSCRTRQNPAAVQKTPPAARGFIDSRGDGFPDAAHLTSASDRQLLRRWIAFIAEDEFQHPKRLATQVDCAGFARFVLQEALRRHDSHWWRQSGLEPLLVARDVQAWNYPHGPLGATLFRTAPGAFHPSDLHNGNFSEFADARHLILYNTVRVSRSVSAARPGDLLFFNQPGHVEPYHTMLFIGRSAYFPNAAEPFVVYDTGASPGQAAKIRMIALSALRRYPVPRWRPVRSNPHFLGVYRWKLLD